MYFHFFVKMKLSPVFVEGLNEFIVLFFGFGVTRFVYKRMLLIFIKYAKRRKFKIPFLTSKNYFPCGSYFPFPLLINFSLKKFTPFRAKLEDFIFTHTGKKFSPTLRIYRVVLANN